MADYNLVNDIQLKTALQQVSKNWDIEVAKDIKHFGDIQSIKLDNTEGYSSGVTFTIRAQMFPDVSRTSVKVYALPAIAYFPDNPKKNPLRISFQTVEVEKAVQAAVLDSSEVKVPLEAMSGQKSAWIVYGQTVLDNTKTSIQAEDKHFVVTSEINISALSESAAVDYFTDYQSLVSSLNAELSKMNNVHRSELYEKEFEDAEKEQKVLHKQSYTEIKDKSVFTKLVGWQLNSENQVEEPASELGHWSYDDPDADDEYNVTVEVINYGDHFEMLYLISYDEALDENEDKLNDMLASVQKYVSRKLPKGASSVKARGSNFYGIGEVVVTYSLEKGPTGKQLYDYAEKFSEFVQKTYSKAQEIAEDY